MFLLLSHQCPLISTGFTDYDVVLHGRFYRLKTQNFLRPNFVFIAKSWHLFLTCKTVIFVQEPPKWWQILTHHEILLWKVHSLKNMTRAHLFWRSRAQLGVAEDLGYPSSPWALRRGVTQQVQSTFREFGRLQTRLLPGRQLLRKKLSHLGWCHWNKREKHS